MGEQIMKKGKKEWKTAHVRTDEWTDIGGKRVSVCCESLL